MDINVIREDKKQLESDIMGLIRTFNSKYEAYPVMSINPIVQTYHLTHHQKDVVAVDHVHVVINPIGV